MVLKVKQNEAQELMKKHQKENEKKKYEKSSISTSQDYANASLSSINEVLVDKESKAAPETKKPPQQPTTLAPKKSMVLGTLMHFN